MAQLEFLNNKYTIWYYKIISNAKDRVVNTYTEKHHIVPRSLGGNDLKNNLVNLTAREHFVCHLLLTKMTVGHHKKLMEFAVGKFIQTAPGQQRHFSSWEYTKIRETISNARKGMTHSSESRAKMSKKSKGRTPWNKGTSGLVHHSEESNKKRSATLKGKTLEDKVGETRADEIKKKISNSKQGKPSGMLGKVHPRKGSSGLWQMPDESKKKISSSKTGIALSESHRENVTAANKISGEKRRGIKQTTVQCPHCGKIGGVSLLKRYHLDNCKHKQ